MSFHNTEWSEFLGAVRLSFSDTEGCELFGAGPGS